MKIKCKDYCLVDTIVLTLFSNANKITTFVRKKNTASLRHLQTGYKVFWESNTVKVYLNQ